MMLETKICRCNQKWDAYYTAINKTHPRLKIKSDVSLFIKQAETDVKYSEVLVLIYFNSEYVLFVVVQRSFLLILNIFIK